MAEEKIRNKKPRLRSPTRRSREKDIEVFRVKETGKNPGRPWTVTGVYLDGKRVRRFFATRDEAELFARRHKLLKTCQTDRFSNK